MKELRMNLLQFCGIYLFLFINEAVYVRRICTQYGITVRDNLAILPFF